MNKIFVIHEEVIDVFHRKSYIPTIEKFVDSVDYNMEEYLKKFLIPRIARLRGDSIWTMDRRAIERYKT